MVKANITIIGAGVIGLSVAAHLSEHFDDIYLIERHPSFGNETSSRNSEVIHASIYYPPDSLKGKLCLLGNELMYETCKKYGIPHKNTEKLIVACSDEEVSRLPALLETAQNNGAKGVHLIDEAEIKRIEPNISAKAAMRCPTSGVVDSHRLMMHLEAKALSQNVNIVYNHELIAAEKSADGYELKIKDKTGEVFTFSTTYLVNCAGLASGAVSAMLGIDIDKENYRIQYLKGMYFRVNHNLDKFPQRLIYPIPPGEGVVGVHTCPDLAGGMRLGPYDEWVNEIEYTVDESLREIFYKQAKIYLPFLSIDDLSPDTAGIHPKVQKLGEDMKDFIIRHEVDKGLERFVNLVGMESPALTSSIAIGRYVNEMFKEIV